MGINLNTIQTVVNIKYLPTLVNNIFVEPYFLLAKIKQNYKTYNERKILVPLEYAKATNIGFVARGGVIAVTNEEILTDAQYTPSMFYGTLTLLKQDELEATSDMAVVNFLQTKMKNLQRSMESYMANYIWTRGTAEPTAPNWETIDHLVNNSGTITCGGITSTVPNWWKSNILTQTDFTDSLATETDLLNPNKDCYIKKLLQRVVALCVNVGGQDQIGRAHV